MGQDRERLHSWKEIAAYLKRDVRTVQRWEKSEGLPVHRQVHRSLATVYAFPHEIDSWLEQKRLRHELVAADESDRGGDTVVVNAGDAARRSAVARIGFLIVLAGAATLAIVYALHRSVTAGDHPTVLVAAAENRTGDSTLDEMIPFLIERDLSNSGFDVIPRPRIEDTLRLLRKNVKTRVDQAVAREICVRDPGIRAVLVSRAERAGRKYLLIASLLDPGDSRVLGAATEETSRAEELPDVIAALTAALGKRIARRGFTTPRRDPPEPVTTPSAKVVQLCSEAYRAAFWEDYSVWEDLSRKALAEDPQFASAHLWLAWCLWNLENGNQAKRPGEWRQHLDKAVALSATATERERLFIRASELTMEGKDEAAVPIYREMLNRYPDDFWARNNLLVALRKLGKTWEAVAETYRLSEYRPTSAKAQWEAMTAALSVSDLTRAHVFAARARSLVEANPDAVPMPIQQHVKHFDLHELWTAGRLEELESKLERVTSPQASWATC